MPKEKGNIYDRVFRENAQFIFIPLIEMYLGIKITKYVPLPEKIAKTMEREVDFLYKITTSTQQTEILHIEFQTKNDHKMLVRMQEYHGIIYRKYQLPIRHIVIFLGEGRSTMKTRLEDKAVFKGFQLINLYELNRDSLLSNQVPEVIILALLSKFDKKQIEPVLRLIVQRLKQVTQSDKVPSRYINQLLILSRLRNLGNNFTKIIEDMPIAYDITKDTLYNRGIKIGRKSGIEEGTEKTLVKSVMGFFSIGVSVEKIAIALDLEENQVIEIIKKFEKK